MSPGGTTRLTLTPDGKGLAGKTPADLTRAMELLSSLGVSIQAGEGGGGEGASNGTDATTGSEVLSTVIFRVEDSEPIDVESITLTAFSAAATSIANVGPALGPIAGPAGNFSTFPDAAKWLMSLGMLMGRLELFTVIVLLSRSFWRP